MLLHGPGGDATSLRVGLRPSRRAGGRTLRDPLGHGYASRPLRGFSVNDLALHLERILDRLKLAAAVIPGGSSGGFTARRFFIDHAERTRGLALLGPPTMLRGEPEVEKVWESTLPTLEDPVDQELARTVTQMTMPSSVPESRVTDLLRQRLKMSARVLSEPNRGLMEDDSTREFPRIASPTLIMRRDKVAISSKQARKAMAVGIPNARFFIYPGAAQNLYSERPERAAADPAGLVRDVVVGRRRVSWSGYRDDRPDRPELGQSSSEGQAGNSAGGCQT